MSRPDVNELLRALDFNGTHSEDVVAAVYFRQSAIVIRELERERDHHRHASSIERFKAQDAQRAVRELTVALDAARAVLHSAHIKESE